LLTLPRFRRPQKCLRKFTQGAERHGGPPSLSIACWHFFLQYGLCVFRGYGFAAWYIKRALVLVIDRNIVSYGKPALARNGVHGNAGK